MEAKAKKSISSMTKEEYIEYLTIKYSDKIGETNFVIDRLTADGNQIPLTEKVRLSCYTQFLSDLRELI